MQSQLNPEPLDLLIVGAGPTGIAIGAAARAAGLNILLVDRGQLTQGKSAPGTVSLKGWSK